ncbi:hypothetical protein ACVBEF_16980 [Glaciimonas sp. GG7]
MASFITVGQLPGQKQQQRQKSLAYKVENFHVKSNRDCRSPYKFEQLHVKKPPQLSLASKFKQLRKSSRNSLASKFKTVPT